eukprot:TRINITY_DN13892_c0_g1_i1.p1 TRINITY_DN13892_c0_g1~~TRINITY_DN13892_c0_g1_i1.p1  ORF type:complete len:439 (+),score=63.98 TRINITY_DN13892_c0_g1_i1:56-1372(+)
MPRMQPPLQLDPGGTDQLAAPVKQQQSPSPRISPPSAANSRISATPSPPPNANFRHSSPIPPARILTSSPPPCKKKRTDDTTYPVKPWKLRAVLGDDAINPVPLIPALAAQILDKNKTSMLIQKLNSVLPLPGLRHLKRVKSCREGGGEVTILLLLWILDQQNCDIQPALVIKKLVEAGVDSSAFAPTFRKELVAKFGPLTRTQFDQLKESPSYWPCNFHEDKYFESLVTSSHELWSEENRANQDKYMRLALRAEENSDAGCGGGVVVDPSSNTIIAEGHGTGGHPLHHTVINLVDLVARSQGGGALEHTGRTSTFRFTSTTSSNRAESAALEEEEAATSHNRLKRYGSIAQLSTVPKTGPYLCTGYDVYLSREPCHMCSMALIHMRTRRVFYSRPSRDGALGSADKIHTFDGLNHRYEVFCGILYDDSSSRPLSDCS